MVACMEDPNPLVRGQGFAKLRDAGIDVSSGILEEQAKALNESFAKYIRHHIPLVTLKAAMTLDGKIALPTIHSPNHVAGKSSRSEWITGEGARAIEEGWVANDGKMPINPSGGLKAKGHPIGATGVSMHVLAAMQLTGTAGGIQVPNATLAGVFNMGGAAVANYASVLERLR